MNSKRVLQKVLAAAEEKRDKLAAVFDLDSTLYNVAFRITQILRDFAHSTPMRRQFHKECQLLEEVTHHPRDWGIEVTCKKAGIIRPSKKFKETLSDFWFQRFHSGEYLKYDEPMSGATDFVQALHQNRIEIIYLTGRDVHRYLDGTLDILARDGFPLSSHAEAVLKPHLSWNDAHYKSNYISEIKSRFQEIWFFENEPVNLNQVDDDHRDVELVFFDGSHSGKAEPRDHYHRITHFRYE